MKKKLLRNNASFSLLSKTELTETEKEVLFLWTKEFLTIKKISIRRRTTKRAVQYTMRKLRKKGYLNKKNMGVKKNLCGINFSAKKIRFHGLEFNIKILFKDQRYKDTRNKCNFLDVDGNTIRLFKDAIEVYVNHSFYANDVDTARKEGFNYCNRLFTKLESELKIILTKPKTQNIKLVKHHFAEVNNEFSKDLNEKKEKMQIRGDDGKVWLLVDNSMNLNELETIHPELAEKDMRIIKDFFDDTRKHGVKSSDVLLILQEYMSGLGKKINALTDVVHSNALTLQAVLKIITPEVPESQKKPSDEFDVSYVG